MDVQENYEIQWPMLERIYESRGYMPFTRHVTRAYTEYLWGVHFRMPQTFRNTLQYQLQRPTNIILGASLLSQFWRTGTKIFPELVLVPGSSQRSVSPLPSSMHLLFGLSKTKVPLGLNRDVVHLVGQADHI